jgi:hypothetical protein
VLDGDLRPRSTGAKGGLAVMLGPHHGTGRRRHLRVPPGRRSTPPSGLAGALERPDLLEGDVALLGEPTDGVLEAGCQGTMRIRVQVKGERAHTARPWMGRNAIHRLGDLLVALADQPERRPVILGCEYREALQVVAVSGGVSGNVVPDHAEVLINHRFAPDRSAAEAEAHVRRVVAPWLDDGDEVDVVDLAPAAAPALDHPLLAALVARNDLPVRAKLGWTDVARFAERGIPAANFGPGDATIAHTAGSSSTWAPIAAAAAVHDLLHHGPDRWPSSGGRSHPPSSQPSARRPPTSGPRPPRWSERERRRDRAARPGVQRRALP